MPRARKTAESGRKNKIQKQEEEEMLRLTIEVEMSLPGCMSLPQPEPAKMLSWVEPWREECSLVVTDSRNAKPENELLGQMVTPTRPCQSTRTPSRPSATATSPMTLLPGRVSPSQLVLHLPKQGNLLQHQQVQQLGHHHQGSVSHHHRQRQSG